MEGNKQKCSIALTQTDGSYRKYGDYLIGAYKAHATGSKLYSRSGITPTASVSQAGFINYANARGAGFDIIDYEMHCAKIAGTPDSLKQWTLSFRHPYLCYG